MSQPKFITINQIRDGYKVPVSVPALEFTALYTTDTVRLNGGGQAKTQTRVSDRQ